jgi:hypothetical protein
MAVWIWCELVCHNCSRKSEGRHTNSSTVPRPMLLKQAKAAGWLEGSVHTDEIYCSKKCRHQKEGV